MTKLAALSNNVFDPIPFDNFFNYQLKIMLNCVKNPKSELMKIISLLTFLLVFLPVMLNEIPLKEIKIQAFSSLSSVRSRLRFIIVTSIIRA